MAWQSRPIFISSTFADMQGERDHLRTHVFPALEERLRARRRHLEWVDLRLGVAVAGFADAEQREMEVLKVCLDEVGRCRPFLIVLLGDRYGWVPPGERMQTAAREAGFPGNVVGRSVTDLEISYGILGDPAQQPRSFFYFRHPLPYAQMPADVAAQYDDASDRSPGAADRCRRLAALKQEIESKFPRRVHRYPAGWDHKRRCVTGLEAWGEKVIEDIWSDLAAETERSEAQVEISWQHAERVSLDDYIEDRARDFIGREEVLSRLEDHAQQGAAWAACLIGEAGSGKSAIFGELCRRFKRGSNFVLAHAASASARAPSVEDMLRRWIDELGTALGTEPDLPDNADTNTVDATFRGLLERMAAQRRVIVLVDALDQFEPTPRGRFMTWLPRAWPTNARFVATAVPGDASKALGELGSVEMMPLPPLDVDEARRITERICARYHRKLEPAVLDALLARRGKSGGPAWGNTLWLVLAVEELNLIDADDFKRATRRYSGSIAERLCALMLDIVSELRPDTPALYAQTFERAERIFGSLLVQSFLGFIAVSRAGWRETDLRSLLPRATEESWREERFGSIRRLFRRHVPQRWDGLRVASMRRLFRGQVRQRGALGQWDFNHAQMRDAVRQYLVVHHIAETSIHAKIVDHLLSLPPNDSLRQSETMVHLLGAKDWSRAAMFYGSKSLTDAELEGATRVLADTIIKGQAADGRQGLDRVLGLLDATRDPEVLRQVATRFLFDLDHALSGRAKLSDSGELLRKVYKAYERLIKADPEDTELLALSSEAHRRIGDIQRHEGDLSAALASFEAESATASIPKLKPKRGERILDQLKDLEITPLNFYEMAAKQEGRGMVLLEQGNYETALLLFEMALSTKERLADDFLDDSSHKHALGLAHQNVGRAQFELGNLAESLRSYEAALSILEPLAHAEPGDAMLQRDVGALLLHISKVKTRKGDSVGALKAQHRANEIMEGVARADPENTNWQRDVYVTNIQSGNAKLDDGDLPAALMAYQKALAIANHLADADQSNIRAQRDLAVSYGYIGTVQQRQGNLTAAVESFQAAHVIFATIATNQPGNVDWQLDLCNSLHLIGDVQKSRGEQAAALASYEGSFAIANRISSDKGWSAREQWQRMLAKSHFKIADLQSDQGNFSAALKGLAASHAIVEKMAEIDPGDAELQHELYVTLSKIGDTHRAQGDQAETARAYEASLAIADHQAKANPTDTEWHRSLAVALAHVADVQRSQGNLSMALQNYRKSHESTARLVETDPNNTGWQRDLSVGHARLGTVLGAQGKLRAAREHHQASLDIRERLAKADPENAQWQHDLAVGYGRLATIEAELGARERAVGCFRQGRDILVRLMTRFPDNIAVARDLTTFERNIAALSQESGILRRMFRRK